jgi:hypothetical protein
VVEIAIVIVLLMVVVDAVEIVTTVIPEIVTVNDPGIVEVATTETVLVNVHLVTMIVVLVDMMIVVVGMIAIAPLANVIRQGSIIIKSKTRIFKGLGPYAPLRVLDA